MSDKAQIAAFLASRGVTRVEPGVSTLNYTRRDWRAAVRGEKTEADLISERRVAMDHAGREHVTNGLGERIA